MEELVGVLLGEAIVELALEFSIERAIVLLALGPLAARAELLDTREQEWSSCVILCRVLVAAKVHLEVELGLVGVAEAIRALLDQVLVLSTVTSIVEVKNGWSQDRTTRTPPLKNSAE